MQELAVALAVVAALGYLCVKYMPAGLRTRLVWRLAGHPRLARWLAKDTSCASGCDTCGSCDDDTAADAPREHVITIHRRN